MTGLSWAAMLKCYAFIWFVCIVGSYRVFAGWESHRSQQASAVSDSVLGLSLALRREIEQIRIGLEPESCRNSVVSMGLWTIVLAVICEKKKVESKINLCLTRKQHSTVTDRLLLLLLIDDH